VPPFFGLCAKIRAMPIEQIVQQLRAERDRLDAAIKALTGSGAKPARPSGGGKKTMSAAARRRISIAQKARWAKRTSSGQTGTAGSPKRTMSAAARRKIAAAQRARWAKVKAGKKMA